MNRNFDRALSLVLKHEGGYVNHPSDPGGATNKGVTIGTFRRYVKANGTVADLKAITNEQVALVYRRHYWNAVKADELPSGVDYAVFDFAVNSGPGRAARYLQACIGVAVDGQIGPQTVAACRQLPADQIIENLCDDRMDFLRALKTWRTFGKGWTSRVTGVRKEALAMAVDAHRPTPKTPPSQNPETASHPVSTGFMAWLRRFWRRDVPTSPSTDVRKM